MTSTDRMRVVLAGATGRLGRYIARALLAHRGVELAILVRPQSRTRAADLVAAGATLHAGSLEDTRAIQSAVEGAFSVISAVEGGPDEIIAGQGRLLEAARRAGVRRFIPSDYSFDFFGLEEGENISADWRRRFAALAALRRGQVQVVHVLNGCFLGDGVRFGFLGAFDPDLAQAHLWGDGDARMNFTSLSDVAAFTAIAATRDDVPDRFEVAGDTLTFWQLRKTVARAMGRRVQVVRRGSLDDMGVEIDRRRREQPRNPFAWLPLMYLRGMLSGKGRLKNPIHTRYPEVVPTTVAAHLAARRLRERQDLARAVEVIEAGFSLGAAAGWRISTTARTTRAAATKT
jgi:nucleoside-diphosphate-sugar epimerase